MCLMEPARTVARVSVLETVREWRNEEGWGVLVSAEVEGTVFAHFNHIQATGCQWLSLSARRTVGRVQ